MCKIFVHLLVLVVVRILFYHRIEMVTEVGDEVTISRTSGIIVTVTRIEPQRKTEALAEEDEAGPGVLQVGTKQGEVQGFHKERDSCRLHSDKKACKEALPSEPKIIPSWERTSLEEIFGHNFPTPRRCLM
jgi:hypothetical protein